MYLCLVRCLAFCFVFKFLGHLPTPCALRTHKLFCYIKPKMVQGRLIACVCSKNLTIFCCLPPPMGSGRQLSQPVRQAHACQPDATCALPTAWCFAEALAPRSGPVKRCVFPCSGTGPSLPRALWKACTVGELMCTRFALSQVHLRHVHRGTFIVASWMNM